MTASQDFGVHLQDSKTIFRILRSYSNRQNVRIRGRPGDRSSISCHSDGERYLRGPKRRRLWHRKAASTRRSPAPPHWATSQLRCWRTWSSCPPLSCRCTPLLRQGLSPPPVTSPLATPPAVTSPPATRPPVTSPLATLPPVTPPLAAPVVPLYTPVEAWHHCISARHDIHRIVHWCSPYHPLHSVPVVATSSTT
jgi:hypothetical protein